MDKYNTKPIELWRELNIDGNIINQFTYDFGTELECDEFFWKHLYEGGSPFSWYVKIGDETKYLTKSNSIIMTKNNEIDLENEKEVRKFIDEYKIPTMNVKVPEIFTTKVADYHEFRDIAHTIKDILGLEYDYEEVGCSYDYEAVFWIKSIDKPEDFINALKKTYEFGY